MASKTYPKRSKNVKSTLTLFEEAKLANTRRIREAMRELSQALKKPV